MFRKFINGLIFGAGFGIAFVVIWMIAILFVFPMTLESGVETRTISSEKKQINSVPLVAEPKRYLSSLAIYSGNFLHNKASVLSGGPGHITGSVSANLEPVEGVKLRLAFNGSVMSQWANTDSSGKYIISVPYGKYVVDGFELDRKSANEHLANKIIHPQSPHTTGILDVSLENDGYGLDFKFVDPIVKKIGKKKYTVKEEIVLEWEPYPDAKEYSVQIYEKPDPFTWSNKTLFQWTERPKLTEARINLKEYGIQLKPGYFYVLDISSRDEKGRILSEAVPTHSGYDFEVAE